MLDAPMRNKEYIEIEVHEENELNFIRFFLTEIEWVSEK